MLATEISHFDPRVTLFEDRLSLNRLRFIRTSRAILPESSTFRLSVLGKLTLNGQRMGADHHCRRPANSEDFRT